MESKYGLIDCKRISENNCIIITESKESFYHVVYKEGKLFLNEILINVEMIENLSGHSRIVSFMKGKFVILH